MDSIFHGRSLVPLFEISRPPLKPPWSTCLSEIDSNQAFQAFMISGVGFSNPRCRNINFFTSLSFRFTGVLKGLPAGKVWLTYSVLSPKDGGNQVAERPLQERGGDKTRLD